MKQSKCTHIHTPVHTCTGITTLFLSEKYFVKKQTKKKTPKSKTNSVVGERKEVKAKTAKKGMFDHKTGLLDHFRIA